MVNKYIFYNILIDVECNKFIKNFENDKSLGFNVNEIRVDESLVNNKDLLETYFLDCQCALFIVDITSNESFTLIKSLIEQLEKIIKTINDDNKKNFDNGIKKENLNQILILNKFDLESDRKVSQEDISFFLNNNQNIESVEISLKTLQGIPELNNKLLSSYKIIKENNLPSDNLYEEEDIIKDLEAYSNLNVKATINCILIGESEVGKSCFLMRYFKNQFCESFLTTVGIDKETKNIKIDNDLYRLTLWDTAGQERFRSLPAKYYQNADGVLLLFDVNNRETFEKVDIWFEDLKKSLKKDSRKNVYLIGNKIDLKREVTKEEAIKKANEFGMKYFEASSKININVCDIMSRLIISCYPTINKDGGKKLEKKKSKKKKHGGCCGGK